jgi:outer membrane protein TolC
MGLYLLKLLLWCPIAISLEARHFVIASPLPCLTSSNDCVNELTERAIASSHKLQKLSERITIIDERLAVTEDRIDYTKKKKWTNYISTNPVDIIQNIFGGGGVQRDNIAIADLEIKTADLLAAKAELERQQEEEKVEIGDKVLHLLLDYEAASRRHELLSSQLETLNQQREVTRIAYKFGRGSTSQILGMEDRRDRLSEKLVDAKIERDESVRKLIQLIN